MNWIGWTVFSILIGILLFLLVIPYIVIGFGWGVFVTIVNYFYFNFLIWMVVAGEVSYWYIMKLPFMTLMELIKKVFQKGTEANTIGVELKTFEDLKVRYESFTGEKLKMTLNIFKVYLKIESEEQALLFLYKSLIDLSKDPKECEIFLTDVMEEYYDSFIFGL